jgi:VIT1/CCC1 family predicted Fe2+/Mn2+ transporter
MAKKITKKEVKAQKSAANPQTTDESHEQPTPMESFKSTQNIMWVLLSGALAVLVTILLFFPQNLGGGITSVYSLMLWWGLFVMFVCRFIKKNAMFGFIGGSVFGMILQILSPLVTGVVA